MAALPAFQQQTGPGGVVAGGGRVCHSTHQSLRCFSWPRSVTLREGDVSWWCSHVREAVLVMRCYTTDGERSPSAGCSHSTQPLLVFWFETLAC